MPLKTLKAFLLTLFVCVSSVAQTLDYKISYSANVTNRPTNLDNAFKFISNTTGAVTVALPLGLLADGIITQNKNLIKQGKEAAFSFFISSLLTWGFKNTIRRERPFVVHSDIIKLSSGGGYSLPSGHTGTAFALATTLTLNNKKWYVIVPAYTWAGLVGYSRISLGVHYTTDVIAGSVVGFASAYVSKKVNNWLHKEKRTTKNNIPVF